MDVLWLYSLQLRNILHSCKNNRTQQWLYFRSFLHFGYGPKNWRRQQKLTSSNHIRCLGLSPMTIRCDSLLCRGSGPDRRRCNSGGTGPSANQEPRVTSVGNNLRVTSRRVGANQRPGNRGSWPRTEHVQAIPIAALAYFPPPRAFEVILEIT